MCVMQVDKTYTQKYDVLRYLFIFWCLLKIHF